MLVFRFGKDLEKIDFCEKRVVFDDPLDAGVSDAPGVDGGTPVVDATLAPEVPVAPEAPVAAAREAGTATESHEGDKKREVLKASIDIAKLKEDLGGDFAILLEAIGDRSFNGNIKASDITAAGFSNKLKEDLGGKMAVALTGVDFQAIKGIFEKHYTTGEMSQFERTFIEMITAVSMNDLDAKVKALGLDKFEPFKNGTASIDYTVNGFGGATATVVGGGEKYVEFEKAQKAAKGADETAEQREAGKKEMMAAIKANGGWVGSLFMAFAQSKDKVTGKTLIDRLYDGEVPALSVVFGARGVKYGKFEEMYSNIKESAQDTKADGWIGKFEKAVGKGKAAALAEMEALFTNTTGLSLDSFKSYFDGSKALDQTYAVTDGYKAEAGKILEITIPKGEKMLVPPNQDYTVAIGNTAPLAQKKGEAKPATIEAAATRMLIVKATELPPTTILPKGTTVKEIAA